MIRYLDTYLIVLYPIGMVADQWLIFGGTTKKRAKMPKTQKKKAPFVVIVTKQSIVITMCQNFDIFHSNVLRFCVCKSSFELVSCSIWDKILSPWRLQVTLSRGVGQILKFVNWFLTSDTHRHLLESSFQLSTLGTGKAIKMDEFSENFQMFSVWKIMLQIFFS